MLKYLHSIIHPLVSLDIKYLLLKEEFILEKLMIEAKKQQLNSP